VADWRYEASCREVDPELFFPVGTSGPALLQIAEAKAVCRRCPVSTECLRWALESGQDAGVWGGLSEDERRAIKRQGISAAVRRDKLVERGTRPDATRDDVRAAGLALLEDGVPVADVAARLGVTVRTVERWQTGARRVSRRDELAGEASEESVA
jgi:WhiB family transcriptional regulator, redox-sensing transcriptional regulator